MNVSDEDKELYERYNIEMAQWYREDDKDVILNCDKLALFCIISQVQLAMGHPKNVGRGRDIAEEEIRHLIAFLNFPPAMAEVIERGWNPANDIAWPEDESKFQGG